MGETSSLLKASSDTPRGIAAAALLDAFITIILGTIDLITEHTIGGLSSIMSFILMLIIAAGLLVSAHLLIKGKMSGYILAWIMAAVTLVFGAVLSFKIVNSTMILNYYYLLTGLFMAIFLYSKNSKKGLA